MIYILTNTLKSGGAEKQSILLAKSLEYKYKVILVVYYGEQSDVRIIKLLKNFKGDVIFLKGNHILKILTLFRLFRKYKQSVVISYLATTNTLNAVVGYFAGVKIRIGGLRSSKYKLFKLYLQRFLHNRMLTKSVFNNSTGMNDLANKGFHSSKCVLIPNTISIPDRPVSRMINDQVIILSVGRFVEAKDYKTAFLSIASTIRKLNKNIRLKYVIIGYGLLENELREFVRNIEIEEYVEFVINPPDIDEYYMQTDIYLSTSIIEGLSNSIMEAMSYNIPVVATNVGDNEKLIIHNITGYLVNRKGVDEISNYLSHLIENKELRNQFGLKGYYHLKENFSIEKFANRYVDLIEKLKNE